MRLQTKEWGARVSPFFYSVAQISPNITDGYRSHDLLGFGGGGWCRTRLGSQEKAITEAIERWSFLYFMGKGIDDAGLNIDKTSNGFAALPVEFGEERCLLHSACEALERYILCALWDRRNVRLKLTSWNNRLPLDFQTVFVDFLPNLVLYEYSFMGHPDQELFAPIKLNWDSIHFVLALKFQPGGGVVCGSACGTNTSSVAERAILEAFSHQRILNAFKAESLPPNGTITDQRLIYFGRSKSAEMKVKDVIQSNIETTEVLPRPDFIFAKNLQGPWQPEVFVTRILVADSLPITDGDHRRFLI